MPAERWRSPTAKPQARPNQEPEPKPESDRARVRESESTEEPDRVWTQESESKGESNWLWTQEPESTEEPDSVGPRSPMDSRVRIQKKTDSVCCLARISRSCALPPMTPKPQPTTPHRPLGGSSAAARRPLSALHQPIVDSDLSKATSRRSSMVLRGEPL
jgi:hypothetical protein